MTRYAQALELQYQLHEKTAKGEIVGAIIFTEHHPVVTLGKNSAKEHLLASPEQLARQGIDLVSTERGGQVTAHEPGQLVIYPILHLGQMKMSARSYVQWLESSVIDVLSAIGFRSSVDPQYPGVWIDDKKICALGVRIKQRVSMHGLALNVRNDLKLFNQIVPCGIQGKSVVSVQQMGYELQVSEVAEIFMRKFAATLKRTLVGARVNRGLQSEAELRIISNDPQSFEEWS
jgi:lipoate-protein ligase B